MNLPDSLTTGRSISPGANGGEGFAPAAVRRGFFLQRQRAHDNSLSTSRHSRASFSRITASCENTRRRNATRSARANSSMLGVSSLSISSPVSFGSRPAVKPRKGFSPSQLALADRTGRLPKATAPNASLTTVMGIAMNATEQSFPRTDRQLKASASNHSQVAMPFLGVVPDAQLLPSSVIETATFNGCLVEAARHSGLEDQEIADAIHICHGYMSRFMRGVAQQWAKRIVAFMRVTNSLAPLQWMAREMGCELVIRDSQAARIAALQAELHALTGRAAA